MRLARKVNEIGARIVSDNPKRFGLLAVMPFRDVEGNAERLFPRFKGVA